MVYRAFAYEPDYESWKESYEAAKGREERGRNSRASGPTLADRYAVKM
jgi:hypothetical protein